MIKNVKKSTEMLLDKDGEVVNIFKTLINILNIPEQFNCW